MPAERPSAASAPKLILGVEGGGTKTEWALLDERGRELRMGTLPAANLRLIGDGELLDLLRVLPGGATHAGVFLAGCANAADRKRLEGLVQRVWPAAVVAVGGDRESGFATAFGDGDGIAVIAGTGSAVTGRCRGRTDKGGGWGHLLGDTGSGYQLAMTALRYVLSNYDLSRTSDLLSQGILRMLALNRLDDLVAWAANADKMSVAKLAPVVFAAAKEGHQEMISVIQNGAHALAEYTRAVAQRLECEAAEVRLLGGLFDHHREYAEFYTDYTAELLPKANIALCMQSGALGAAWLASRVTPVARPRPDEPDVIELAAAVTEQRNPRSAGMDKLGTPDLVELFIREEDEVARALREASGGLAAAVDLVAAALTAGGRLFYTGAGTSGRLGVLDASEIPPTFGAPPELVQGIIAGGVGALHAAVEGAEDQEEAGELAVVGRGVREGDVVCGIAASGRTPFVLGSLRRARALGAKTMLLTCNPARKHGGKWDVEIDLATGPELVAGSTRLKAGTATKIALNIISTCAMVRLGKVRGNLMIDVQATNCKAARPRHPAGERAARLRLRRGPGTARSRGLERARGAGSVAVIERLDFAPAEMMLDGRGDEAFRLRHGFLQPETARKTGGDGGGRCAAGAVRRHTRDARGAELGDFAAGVKEKIDGLVALEMPAFQQPGRAELRGELPPGLAHFIERAHGGAAQHRGFVQVRRHDSRAAEEELAVELDGLRAQQPVAGGGNHHGIDHQWHARSLEGAANDSDNFGRVEHSRFHRGHGKCLEGKSDLLGYDVCRHGMNGADFSGHLGHHAGNGRQPVSAERREGFEVRLCAGAGAVIGPGDGKADRGGILRHGPIVRIFRRGDHPETGESAP